MPPKKPKRPPVSHRDFAAVLAAAMTEAMDMHIALLSRRSGVSEDSIGKYLHATHEPSLTKFRQLCHGLALAPAEFLERLAALPPVPEKPVGKGGRPAGSKNKPKGKKS